MLYLLHGTTEHQSLATVSRRSDEEKKKGSHDEQYCSESRLGCLSLDSELSWSYRGVTDFVKEYPTMVSKPLTLKSKSHLPSHLNLLQSCY